MPVVRFGIGLHRLSAVHARFISRSELFFIDASYSESIRHGKVYLALSRHFSSILCKMNLAWSDFPRTGARVALVLVNGSLHAPCH